MSTELNSSNKESTKQILKFTKVKLGITSDKRDEYLNSIIDGVISELSESGVKQSEKANYVSFVTDLSAHRFESDSYELPRNLMFRLNGLMVKNDI